MTSLRGLGFACPLCATPLTYTAVRDALVVDCPQCRFLRTVVWDSGRIIACDWDSVPVPATSDLAVADGTDEEQDDTDDR